MRQSAWVHSPLLPARGHGKEGFVWRGLFHVSGAMRHPPAKHWLSPDLIASSLFADLLPTTLRLAGVSAARLPSQLDGFDMWSALVSGADSPRQELLHEIVSI